MQDDAQTISSIIQSSLAASLIAGLVTLVFIPLAVAVNFKGLGDDIAPRRRTIGFYLKVAGGMAGATFVGTCVGAILELLGLPYVQTKIVVWLLVVIIGLFILLRMHFRRDRPHGGDRRLL